MTRPRYVTAILCVVFAFGYFSFNVLGQVSQDKGQLAVVSGGGASVRWDVSVPHTAGTLTVSGPDGQIFRSEFQAGNAAEFRLAQAKGDKLPDGVYTYELRLTPVLSAGVKEALTDARKKGNDEEV